jgi:hypothetical protein
VIWLLSLWMTVKALFTLVFLRRMRRRKREKLLAGEYKTSIPLVSRKLEALAGGELEKKRYRWAEAIAKKTIRGYVNSDLFDHALRAWFRNLEGRGGYMKFVQDRMQSGNIPEDAPQIVRFR